MKKLLLLLTAIVFSVGSAFAQITWNFTPNTATFICDDEPPVITTTTLPNGTIDTEYYTQLTATGTEPITWSLANGNLPNGLTLSSIGVISGIPTTHGTFYFTVQATNSEGSDTKELSITIEECVGIEELKIENGELSIYPNPTTGELTITNYELRIENVAIFDVYGRNVLPHTAYRIPHTVIDISELQAGIYFVRITTEKEIVMKKIIKF